MTQLAEATAPAPQAADTGDLNAALRRVLQASEEPMTVAKVKAALPMALRGANIEEALKQQVAAGAFHQFPKYRSPQERYWDRPMSVHIRALVRQTLEGTALAWPDLRRKLPSYATELAEPVFQEMIAQQQLHRHPRMGGRGSDRYGLEKPDPKEYLRGELVIAFGKLEKLGFSQEQLRNGALELLHEEEWATVPSKEVNETAPEAASETPAALGQSGLSVATPSEPALRETR